MTIASATSMSGKPERAPRMASLDVLRGITVMGMILVNSAAGLFYGHKAPVPSTLLHVPWNGLSLADLVFPAFLMMVGVAIPMALARDAAGGMQRPAARRIVARTLRLFVIGFLLSNLNWFADFGSGEWRLWGVLQRIGLVYGACALLFLACTMRARLTMIAVILLLYWPLTLLPALDGLPNDLWHRGHNFAASVDRWLLGAGNHNYVRGPAGYDPEGLIGTLPAIAHGLIGVAIGEYLLLRRGRDVTAPLAMAGAAMLAAGWTWGFWFPIVKDIWSSSFVLVTSGFTALALAGLHLLVDRRDDAPGLPWTIPAAFGTNAIAAYVLHMVTANVPSWDVLLLFWRGTAHMLPVEAATLLPILAYMGLLWLSMAWLARKGWIIKV